MQDDTWEWDPAFFDLYGVSPQEVVPSGPALLALKHPDDLVMVTTALRGVPRGEEFSLTHRIFRQDGFVRLINTRSTIATDSKGQPAVLRAAVDVLDEWNLPLLTMDVAVASDGELMLGLRAQMPEASAEIFRRHEIDVIRAVRHLGYLSIDADDVVQDVFATLVGHRDRFDARRGSLRAYLRMQARSRCVDIARSGGTRHRRELTRDHFETASPAEHEALLTMSNLEVRLAVANLGDDHRIPIELAFFGGLSYRAVAEHLELPEGTVKARIRSGMERLRDSLGTGRICH